MGENNSTVLNQKNERHLWEDYLYGELLSCSPAGLPPSHPPNSNQEHRAAIRVTVNSCSPTIEKLPSCQDSETQLWDWQLTHLQQLSSRLTRYECSENGAGQVHFHSHKDNVQQAHTTVYFTKNCSHVSPMMVHIYLSAVTALRNYLDKSHEVITLVVV